MLKSLIVLVAIMGLCSLLPSGKAAADTNGGQCPQPNELYNSNAPTNGSGVSLWGYQGGEVANNFGGVIVRAHVSTYQGSSTQGPANTGQSVDTGYVLNSYLPPADNGDSYNIPAGDDRSARIFPLDNTGTQNPLSRTTSHNFQTGETLYDNESPSNPGGDPFSCTGWSALGPGSPGEAGNNWGMDCGEYEYIGGNPNKPDQNIKTRFYINGLNNNYGGTPGVWEIQINGRTVTTDAVGNSMNQNNNYFTIPNGTSTRIDLLWHPQQPQPNQASGTCTNLDVGNPIESESATYTNSGGSHPTAQHVTVTGVSVNQINGNPASGTNIDAYAPGDTGGQGDKTWNYWPSANTIQVSTVQAWYKDTTPNKGMHDIGGATRYYLEQDGKTWTTTPTNISCFSATCSILNVDGDGPWDGTYNPDGTQHHIILAGGNIYVHGTFTNTSPAPNYLTMTAGAYLDGPNGANNLGFTPYEGYAYPFTINLTAPSSVQNYSMSFIPQYNGSETNMSGCGSSVPPHPTWPIYQHFNINPTATISPGTNPENPYIPGTMTHGVGYIVGGSLSDPPDGSLSIGATTTGWLTKQPPGGSTSTVDGPHGTADTYGQNISHSYSYADSITAGNQYCPHVTISPGSGYRGPSGDYGDQDASSTGSCLTVRNEPYLKAFNGPISARNGVTPTAASCSTVSNINNSGLLAGWNDNSDYGADRGAGSQLAALALIKITGAASAQTVNNITRSPTSLTFANNNPSDIASDVDSPSLGGNLGGTPTCNSPPTVASNAANISANAASVPASGAYKHTGTLTLNGGTVSGDTSIYVNGDVYITAGTASGINYGSNPSWVNNGDGSFGGPMFTLVATGNIYIDPGVTQLDGVYAAQPSDATHGGTIYTCSPNAAPPPANYDFYNKCNNQLVVNGTFQANNVKLLRSFGSLRDEEPNPGVGAGNQLGLVWSCGGGTCNSPNGLNCVNVNEPGDTYNSQWLDNKLCVPTSSSLQLAWTHAAYTGSNKKDDVSAGLASLDYLKTHGYPSCIPWTVTDSKVSGWSYMPSPTEPTDNFLCSNQNVGLNFTSANDPAQYCTQITEPGDPQWNNNTNGYWLCEPKAAAGTLPTPKGPPYNGCSNSTGAVQDDTNTCAAEVFRFSPELYLSNPNSTLNLPSGGATQYDAITSLPPVL